MHPVFVARGPAFKKNYSTNADIHIKSVDVYELLCFILNLKPGQNNGTLKYIKDIIDVNYFKNRNNEKSYSFLKKNILRPFLDEINYLSELNRNGHLYVVFLILILIIFIIFLHFLTSYNSKFIFQSSKNLISSFNYRLNKINEDI
jgi:hypothetical protein